MPKCPNAFVGTGEEFGPEPIVQECNPDGTATVHVTIGVAAFESIRIRVNPGGGLAPLPGFVGIVDPAAQNLFFFTYDLRYDATAPSNQTAFIEVQEFDGTPMPCVYDPIPITVAACPSGNCPQILDIGVEIGENCRRVDGTLRRDVTFTPAVFRPTEVDGYVFNFGDGSDVDAGTGTLPAVFPHPYEQVPTNEPTLTIFSENCPPDTETVPLDNFDSFQLCECPRIVGISVTPGGCVQDPGAPLGQLRHKVTFEPVLAGPAPDSWTWTWGDGSPMEMGGGQPPQAFEHYYDGAPTGSIRMCIGSNDASCPDDCHEVPLEELGAFDPCQGEPPDEETPDESSPWYCGVPTIGIAALTAFTAAAGVVMLVLQCMDVPIPQALWIALLAAAVLIAFLILVALALCGAKICPCLTRCDWLIIAWVPLLAAAIIAFYLIGCCPPWTYWIAGSLGALAVGAFVAWYRECRPDLCTIWDMLLVTIVSGVAPTLAYLQLIPIIKACGSQEVIGGVTLAGAVLAVAAAACHARATNPPENQDRA